MCGVLPVLLGTIAFTGTLTVPFQAPVPLGERLIGRATLDGRERRKLFVRATLSSSATSAEHAKASMIMIDAQAE
jgi:acyl dehydratase